MTLSLRACGHLVERGRECQCRGTAAARGYGASWAARRARQLEVQPNCERHLSLGMVEPATDVDHRTRRRLLIAHGHPDPDGDWNLQSLCHSCHSAKTRADGGWGSSRHFVGERARPRDRRKSSHAAAGSLRRFAPGLVA